MPNIGAMLKQEIARLARREVRAQAEAAKKASAQSRRHIAALRRQMQTLARQVALLQRRVPVAPAAAAAVPAQRMRFVAKGLKSQRARLGLSAGDVGRLVGASAQSVYNWEQGHSSPRAEQLARLAARRGIGKREAQRLLQQFAAKDRPAPRKRRRRSAG